MRRMPQLQCALPLALLFVGASGQSAEPTGCKVLAPASKTSNSEEFNMPAVNELTCCLKVIRVTVVCVTCCTPVLLFQAQLGRPLASASSVSSSTTVRAHGAFTTRGEISVNSA